MSFIWIGVGFVGGFIAIQAVLEILKANTGGQAMTREEAERRWTEEDLRAKIEKPYYEGWHDGFRSRDAEIERLRADMDQRMAAYIEYQERDEAEIARRTDALTKIRSVVGTSTEAWHIANHALEHKP